LKGPNSNILNEKECFYQLQETNNQFEKLNKLIELVN